VADQMHRLTIVSGALHWGTVCSGAWGAADHSTLRFPPSENGMG